MKKSDLKPFMLIKTTNRGYYLLVELKNGELIGVRKNRNGWLAISDGTYGNDLRCPQIHDYDIQIVYDEAPNRADILSFSTACRAVLWERKDIKEMTLAEIEEELGYPVKVVKEHG